MTKLKIEPVLDEEPVKITLELPADLDRDLRIYAKLIRLRVVAQ